MHSYNQQSDTHKNCLWCCIVCWYIPRTTSKWLCLCFKVKPLHFFMPTRARGDFQSNINQRAPLFLNANTKKCEKIIAAFVWTRLPKQDHKSCFWSSINQSMFIHLLLHIANPSLLNKVFCVLLGKTCDMNISFVDWQRSEIMTQVAILAKTVITIGP